jgi:hypothetical protein
MVLTYDAYTETIEGQKQKDDKISSLENTVSTIQSQIQSLMSAFSSMKEQPQVDNAAKMLYSSGLLIKAAGDNNVKVREQLQMIKAAGKAAYHATRTKSALTKQAEGKSKA